jgi:hypothetical protein
LAIAGHKRKESRISESKFRQRPKLRRLPRQRPRLRGLPTHPPYISEDAGFLPSCRIPSVLICPYVKAVGNWNPADINKKSGACPGNRRNFGGCLGNRRNFGGCRQLFCQQRFRLCRSASNHLPTVIGPPIRSCAKNINWSNLLTNSNIRRYQFWKTN